MATINKVIEQTMKIHPDNFSDSIKSRWISELDGKIMRETMLRDDFREYSYPEDADKELLVKPPYDNIYELYIIAMSDFYSGEFESYGASAIMFEQAYEEFRKNYLRNNMPPSKPLKSY